MVDIQTISIAIASAGVFVAAIYYMLQLRHQAKTRATDLALRLDAVWESKDFVEWLVTFRERDPKEYDTWVPGNSRKWMAEIQVMGFFNTLGFLLYKKLVDIELACELFPVMRSWEKARFLIERVRKETGNTHSHEWFEYLYNEAKIYNVARGRRPIPQQKDVTHSAPI